MSWGTPHNIALKAHVTASSILNEESAASMVIDQKSVSSIKENGFQIVD